MPQAEYYPINRDDAVNVILTDALPPVADYRGQTRIDMAKIVLQDLIDSGYVVGADIDGPLTTYYTKHIAENGYTWDSSLTVDQSEE
jgi:hypothetical protein